MLRLLLLPTIKTIYLSIYLLLHKFYIRGSLQRREIAVSVQCCEKFGSHHEICKTFICRIPLNFTYKFVLRQKCREPVKIMCSDRFRIKTFSDCKDGELNCKMHLKSKAIIQCKCHKGSCKWTPRRQLGQVIASNSSELFVSNTVLIGCVFHFD